MTAFVDTSGHGNTNGNLEYSSTTIFVSVIRQKRTFKVDVDPLEWLSGFDKGNLIWAMELRFTFTTNRAPACHLLDLIERIR